MPYYPPIPFNLDTNGGDIQPLVGGGSAGVAGAVGAAADAGHQHAALVLLRGDGTGEFRLGAADGSKGQWAIAAGTTFFDYLGSLRLRRVPGFGDTALFDGTNARLRVGDATAPGATLDLAATGPLWTTSSWTKALRVPNVAAIEFLGGGPLLFGLGGSSGSGTAAFYLFETTAEDASAVATYRLILENGVWGINGTPVAGLAAGSMDLTGASAVIHLTDGTVGKFIRAVAGVLQIANSAFSVQIFALDDTGNGTFAGTVAAAGLAGSLLSAATPKAVAAVGATGVRAIPSRDDHVHEGPQIIHSSYLAGPFPTTAAFTKALGAAASDLLVMIQASAIKLNAAGLIGIKFTVGGTTYGPIKVYSANFGPNEHRAVVGVAYQLTGLAAGNYTVAYSANSVNDGNDANDFFDTTVLEVPK